jgi:hypothetical protein
VETAHKSHGQSHGEGLEGYPDGDGGFSRLFHELEICANADPRCLEPRAIESLADAELTLIGHSLGAVIVDDLIYLYDDLPYRNVVHMGSAESVRHFLETVPPVMASQPEMRFYNLSLHPLAEAREAAAWGTAPSGSLLEWIDLMYEVGPPTLDRSLGKWSNVAAAADAFPEPLRDRMLFKVFGFRPANAAIRDPGDPTAHGDFNDTEMHYWLPDFWGKPEAWDH